MNLGLAAATFAIVLPAELPDKTFVSAIVLASKYRPLPVWVGTAAGLVLQAGIGVVAGRLLALLPHRAVEAVVAGLFLAGAAYLLVVPERAAETAGIEAAAHGGARVPHGDPGEAGPAAPAARDDEGASDAGEAARAGWWIAATSFGIVALAELGDLTQVVIANLSARSKDPLSVFVGAAFAFLVVSAVGVAAGRTLTRYVPLALVRRLSGVVLAGLGCWSLVNAVAG